MAVLLGIVYHYKNVTTLYQFYAFVLNGVV